MKALLFEAKFKTLTRATDGSVKIGLQTLLEVSNDQFKLYDQYWGQTCWAAIKPDEFDPNELPDENTKIKGQVSPSLYLRTRLFAKHMKTGGTKESFPAYYERAMHGFANAVDASYED